MGKMYSLTDNEEELANISWHCPVCNPQNQLELNFRASVGLKEYNDDYDEEVEAGFIRKFNIVTKNIDGLNPTKIHETVKNWFKRNEIESVDELTIVVNWVQDIICRNCQTELVTNEEFDKAKNPLYKKPSYIPSNAGKRKGLYSVMVFKGKPTKITQGFFIRLLTYNRLKGFKILVGDERLYELNQSNTFEFFRRLAEADDRTYIRFIYSAQRTMQIEKESFREMAGLKKECNLQVNGTQKILTLNLQELIDSYCEGDFDTLSYDDVFEEQITNEGDNELNDNNLTELVKKFEEAKAR